MPISHNIGDLRRGLSDLARRQIPFAVSLGINRTLADVKRNADKRLTRRLDRPTPFTLRAFRIRRASKRRLAGAVFAQPIQAAYLRFAEAGGSRRPRGRAIPIPVGQRRNTYGNMPRRAVTRLLARPDTFSGTPGGRPGAAGIYKRTRRGLRLLVAYADRARYRKRLGFRDAAEKTAAARLAVHVDRALREALRTAHGSFPAPNPHG